MKMHECLRGRMWVSLVAIAGEQHPHNFTWDSELGKLWMGEGKSLDMLDQRQWHCLNESTVRFIIGIQNKIVG